MFKPARYVNEIVSLTIMLLMAVALITGQADATVHGAKIATAVEHLQAVEGQIKIYVVTDLSTVTD